MLTKSKLSKILKKQKRCQAIISNEIKIPSSDEPTKFLAICNAGLSTGLQQEILLESILKFGSVENLIMLPNKSYCFLQCPDIVNSKLIYDGLNGHSKLGQNGSIIYLSYFQGIPNVETNKFELPPGLIILEDFITQEEEENLLESIQTEEIENTLKHRVVKHYGYEFLYETNNVNPKQPLDKKIPENCSILWTKLKLTLPGLQFSEPDQLTVNRYKAGQGIPPHVDTHSAFSDLIISLSLEGDIVMEFRKMDDHYSVLLPRRSLLIMTGESRYDWTHGITPRYMDVIQNDSAGLTVRNRTKRTSLTFRKIKLDQCCDCKYPRLCDTAKQTKVSGEDRLSEVAAALEMKNVHSVYDEIAEHFSETRHSPWPKVKEFMESFSIGDIVLDIGCGNGKYLGLNKNIMSIGCDRSTGLLKICLAHGYSVFGCDCLSLPIRDLSVNGCISIAVIHHLATEDRRIQTISEMSRVLQKGGRALIYVWAQNQEMNEKKSSYLRQNKAINKNKITENELIAQNKLKYNFNNEINLPIHTNRTKFKDKDVLVPWKLKSNIKITETNSCENSLFLRYYHVFDENELEQLCKKVNNIKILSTYYDQEQQSTYDNDDHLNHEIEFQPENFEEDDILFEPKIDSNTIIIDGQKNKINHSSSIDKSDCDDEFDDPMDDDIFHNEISSAADISFEIKTINNSIKNFQCKICSKKFQRKTAYVNHAKYCVKPLKSAAVTSERIIDEDGFEHYNFECNLCSKHFTKKCGLTNHLKFCGKSKQQILEERIKRENDMKLEEFPNPDELPYVNGELMCRKCSKTFQSLSGYTAHSKFCGKPIVSIDEILKQDKLKRKNYENEKEKNLNDELQNLYNKIKKEETDSYNQQILTENCDQSDSDCSALSDGGEKELKCKKCSKVFKNISGWKTHMKFSAHSTERIRKKRPRKMGPFKKLGKKVRPFRCKKCKICFDTEDNFKLHQENPCPKLHRYACEHCGKLFKENIILQDHIRAYHTMEKPFVCDFEGCTKAFSSKFKLTGHKKRHDPTIFFQCSYCDRKLSEKSKLKAHERIHRNELPFSCHLCPKKFRTGSVLNTHIKKHVNAGSFVCEICSQRFNDIQTLRHHKICHSNEKPFGCSICGARFPRKNSYSTHMKTHSNKYEYVCKICSKSFPHYTAIYTHYKQHGIKYSTDFEKTGIISTTDNQQLVSEVMESV